MSDFNPIGYTGEIRMFAGTFAPAYWQVCDGSLLLIALYERLYSVIGTTYGGDGTRTFAVPDLRGRAPMHMGNGAGLTSRTVAQSGGSEQVTLSTTQMPQHSHGLSGVAAPAIFRTPQRSSFMAESERTVYASAASAPVAMSPSSIAAAGGGLAHDNMQPFACVNFIICLEGLYPVKSGGGGPLDSDPYTGEIRMFASDYAPQGWTTCDGQRVLIGKNGPLFAVIGTTYGGDGREMFALPDLQGRVPIHPGASRFLGGAGGSAAVALTEDNLPSHSHSLVASSATADSDDAAGNMLGAPSGELYAPETVAANLTSLSPKSLGLTGGGQPHNNTQPYLTVTFIICLSGFDPRTGL